MHIDHQNIRTIGNLGRRI